MIQLRKTAVGSARPEFVSSALARRSRLLITAFCVCLPALAGSGAPDQHRAGVQTLAVGDFNGDRRSDVLYIGSDSSQSSGIALSDVSGSMVDHQFWSGEFLGIPWQSGYYQPIVADFNGDGRDDLLLQSKASQGWSFLLFPNADGRFDSIYQTIPGTCRGLSWSATDHRIIAGNFRDNGTGVGTTDAHASRRELLLQPTRPGGIAAVVTFTIDTLTSGEERAHIDCGSPESDVWADGTAGFDWSSERVVVHAGDFDADGVDEIFIHGKDSSGLARFAPDAIAPTSLDYWGAGVGNIDWSVTGSQAVVADFSGDERADILLQPNRDGLPAYLFVTSSNGTLTPATPARALNAIGSGEAYQLFAADFSGRSPRRHGLYRQALTTQGVNGSTLTVDGKFADDAIIRALSARHPTAVGGGPAAHFSTPGAVTIEQARASRLAFEKAASGASRTSVASLTSVASHPEIAGLAHALGDDPARIFEYVHDNIRFSPEYGLRKGAVGTLRDEEGGPLDQANLLAELFRAAGLQASIVEGTITVPDAALRAWFGLGTNVAAGFAADAYRAGGTPITGSSVFAHFWVKLADGRTFDPSYKHTAIRAPDPTLASAVTTIRTNAGQALTAAMTGAISTTTSLEKVNRTALRTKLDQFGFTLRGAWNTAAPGQHGLGEVMETRRIVPLRDQGTIVSPTYTQTQVHAGDVPEALQTTVWINGCKLFSIDLYSRTLIMGPTGLQLDSAPVCAVGGTTSLTIFIDEPFFNRKLIDAAAAAVVPYATNLEFGDESTRIDRTADAIGALVFSFGRVSRAHFDAFRTRQILSSTSFPSTSITAASGLTLLAQIGEASKLLEQLSQTRIVEHHSLVYAETKTRAKLSMAASSASAAYTGPNGTTDRRAVIRARAGLVSALEGAALRQSGVDAVSTVRVFDLLAAQTSSTVKFLLLDPASPTTGLTGYSAADLQALFNYRSKNYQALLPSVGNLLYGQWLGTGILFRQDITTPSSDQRISIAHHLTGGLKGAEASVTATEQQRGTALFGSGVDWSRGPAGGSADMATGAYQTGYTAISVGTDRPLSADFSYSSDAMTRFFPPTYQSSGGTAGVMGQNGWSMSLDSRLYRGSDPFAVLGGGVAEVAVPAIVALQVTTKLYEVTGQPALSSEVTNMLVQAWLADYLADNAITVKSGFESTRFIRTIVSAGATVPAFLPADTSSASIVVTTTGSATLNRHDGSNVAFDQYGRATRAQDRFGSGLTFGYASVSDPALTAGARLSNVADDFGNSLSFTQVSGGLEIADQTGRKVTVSSNKLTDARGKTTQFGYSTGVGGVGLTSVTLPAHPGTAATTIAYDDLNRVTAVTNGRGKVTTYRTTPHFGAMRDPMGNESSVVLDADRRPVLSRDPLGRTTRMEYDALSRLSRVVTPDGRETLTEYHRTIHAPTRVTMKAAPGSLDPHTGLALAPIVTSRAYAGPYFQISSETDPLARVTSYEYYLTGSGSPQGALYRVIRPAAESGGAATITQYTYDSKGRPLTETAPDGKITAFSYHATTGAPLSVTSDAGPAPHLNVTTQFTYDAIGNVKTQQDAAGRVVAYDYDADRRVVRRSTPAPYATASETVYDDSGRVIRTRVLNDPVAQTWTETGTAYDAAGFVISATNAEGHTVTYGYDDAGRQTTVSVPVSSTQTLTSTTIYDALGRVTEQRDADNRQIVKNQYQGVTGYLTAVRDGKNNATFFQYDGFGRNWRTLHADNSVEATTFDEVGRLVATQSRAGRTAVFIYDGLDRVKQQTLTGESTARGYTYDTVGRVLTATDGSGTYTHAYDTLGRLKSITGPDGKVVAYDYDSVGRRTKLTYPGADNYFITYEWDELNRVKSIKERGTLALATYGYDALSRRTSMSYGNGVTVAASFETDSALRELQLNFPGAAPEMLKFTYDRDWLNRRTTDTVSDARYVWTPPAPSTTSYAANSLNQYTSAGNAQLAYDSDGNLTSDGVQTYGWNSRSRLVSVTNAQYTASYAYDVFDNRISKTVNGVTTRFLWDVAANEELAEYDGSGVLVRRYVHAPGVDEPLVTVLASGERRYHHADGHGSVTAVTNDTGAVLERLAYGPFGETSNTAGTSLRFGGRRFDPESGLYDQRARYYSPALGRFVSADPIGLGGGINLYAYAENDPVNLADPTGLDVFEHDDMETVPIIGQRPGTGWLWDMYRSGSPVDKQAAAYFLRFLGKLGPEQPPCGNPCVGTFGGKGTAFYAQGCFGAGCYGDPDAVIKYEPPAPWKEGAQSDALRMTAAIMPGPLAFPEMPELNDDWLESLEFLEPGNWDIMEQVRRNYEAHQQLVEFTVAKLSAGGFRVTREVSFKYDGVRSRYDIVATANGQRHIFEIKTGWQADLSLNQMWVKLGVEAGLATPVGRNARIAGYTVGRPLGTPELVRVIKKIWP